VAPNNNDRYNNDQCKNGPDKSDPDKNDKIYKKVPMIRISRSCWPILLLCLCSLTAHAASDPVNNANGANALQEAKVKIDRNIFTRPWNKVPFDTAYFTFTNEQMKEKWPHMMRGLKLPFPSIELINYAKQHYPEIMKGVNPALADNTEKYQAALLDVARSFFAGDFQTAYKTGKDLGALGLEMSAFAETIYACYLPTRQSVKYMMLQDVVNTFESFDKMMAKMAVDKNPLIRANAAFAYLGDAYAIARIAEESPIPVVLARGYIEKLKHAASQVLTIYPNHPLGLAFRAGLDAGIMRRVGKFTGRLTYGARTTVAVGDFEKSVDMVPDQAITQYEFANALIYMDQKRELNSAMLHLEAAIRARPSFAMEALDSMYAYKRLQEIRLYALDYRSFRQFDNDRRHFIDVTDRNLNNVMAPNLTLDMLKHPEKYKLPPLK
jgi:hypothetical protein